MEIDSYIARIDLLDYLVILVNLLLMIFARKILLMFQSAQLEKRVFVIKVQSFRALNLLIILSYGYTNIYLASSNTDTSIGIKLISIWVIIYLSQY